jgi:hypothetical protein
MIPIRPFLTVLLTAAALASGAADTHAATYSDEQLELAGQIGAAVALSRICSGTVPTTAVVKALEASGLTESDVLGDTPIRERMRRQASEVMSTSRLRGEGGRSQAEIVKHACDGFRASFGPNGFLPPEATD